MDSFSVDPFDLDEGVAGMLTALGEARIEVRGVAMDGARYRLKIEGSQDLAEEILELKGYRVHRGPNLLAS